MRTVELFVNSYIDRITEENGDATEQFTVTLNDESKRIGLLAGESKMRIKVFSLEIPNVLYNFSQIESRIFFVWDVDGGNTVEEIQIDTERVYASATDLINQLNQKITDHATLTDLVFSYNDSTKKITLTNDSTVKVRLISSFRYADTESIITFEDMNDRLGFSQELTNTIVGPNESLEGEGWLKMNRTSKYHLALRQQGGYFNQSIIPSSNLSERIICSVGAGAYGSLSTLNYVSSFAYQMPSTGTIDTLTFRLLDDEFRPIQMRNYGITMTIHFEIE